jgi:hypothetical protein
VSAGERLNSRQGRGQGIALSRAELCQEHGELLGPHCPAPGQQRPAVCGDVDLRDPPVGRIGGPVGQACLLQAGDQLGHGRLRHPLGDRERGEPARAGALQGYKRRRRRQR